MASYDGSINIDARLNIKNAVINSKDLGKAIESLKSTVDTFGKDAAQSTNAYVGALEKASTVLGDVSSAFFGIESGAQQMISALSDTSLMQKSWSDLKAEMSDLQAQLEAFKEAGLTSDDWQYAEVEERLKDVSNAVDAKGFNDATQSIKGDIDTLLQQLELLGSAEGVDPYLFEELAQSIPSVISQIGWLANRYEGLSDKSQSAGKAISDSMEGANQSVQDFQDGLGNIENVESEVQSGTQEMANTMTQGSQESANAMSDMSNSTNEAAQSLENASNSATRFVSRIASGAIRLAANTIKSIGSAAIHAASNLAKMVGGGTLSFLRKLAEGAKNAAAQLAKMVSNAVVSGVKKIGSIAGRATKSLLGLNKASSGDGFKDGLKFIVRYGFGVRSLFMLFRKLRGAIVEAFENMAKKVPEVNGSLSRIVSSLDQLKNSLATAFQPILTQIEPILTQFMDFLSDALVKVGEFFAALTGQGYVYKATKAQVDYAKSLDKTKKKAKAAENQLAGFDHLNILKDTKSDSSSSDTDTPTSDFQKIPIESWIQNLADRIKNLFKSGDFFGIGKVLAEELQKLIDKIDFKKLGQKIADGINAVVDAINGFFDNFDFIALGEKLAQGFMSIVDNVDWYNLGKAMTQKIRAVIEGLWGFVSNLDWVKIGKSIGNFLQGAFDNIPWGTLGTLLGTSITGAFQAILTAAETFEWDKAGQELDNGFSNMINSIDIDTIYAALRTTLIGILDLIGYILMDVETWEKIASDFASFMNSFFQDEELWAKLRRTLIGGMATAIASLKKFVSEFEWGKNGQMFHDQLMKLVDEFPLNELGEALSELLTGSLEFLKEAFGDEELLGELGTKLGEFLDSIFNNQELWDTAGETANNMMKGVLAFGEKFLATFKPEDAAANIKTALGKIDWDDIATRTWNLVKKALAKAGSFVEALFSDDSDVSNTETTSLGSKIGTKLAEAVNDAINNYIPWSDIGVIFNDLLNTGLDFANNFVKNFDTDGFLNGITSAMEEIEWDKVLEKILELMINAVGMVGDLTQKLIYRLFGFDDEETTKLISENMERTLEAAMPGSVTPEVKAKMRGYADESADTLADEFIQRMSSGEIVDKDPLLPWFRDADAKASQEALVSKMQEVYQYAADNNIGGEQLSESLFTGFIQSVTDNTTGQVKDEYKSLIENMFGSVDAINNGSLTMEQFFAGLNTGLDDYSGATKEKFLSAIDGMLTEVKESPEGFDEHSPSKRAKSMSADFVAGLTEGIEENKDGFVSSMETALDGVVNTVDSKWGDASNAQSTKLNEMSNALSTTMGDMTNTSTEGTENQAKPVYDKYGDIMMAVEECMRSAWDYMKQYTGNMVSTMQTDMNRVQGNANTGMNGLERSISDSFNRIGSMNWAYIGQNICSGIQQGIYNGWSWLNNTVWNLANSLFQQAKWALGIASPSKVFRDEVGYMVGAGLAEGLDDSQHEVLGSITDMAKAMVDEMQTTDLTADVGVNDDTLLSSISGALSTFSIKIEDSFITLTERLQAIADKVTFITPDIAAGTVLPYAIQGDVNVNTDNVAVTLEKNNEELINIMIQLVNNQTSAIVSGLERYCTTNVNIDKKGLTDAIIEEINRRTRAAGSSPLLI